MVPGGCSRLDVAVGEGLANDGALADGCARADLGAGRGGGMFALRGCVELPIAAAGVVADLGDGSAPVELQRLAIVKLAAFAQVRTVHEAATLVVDHDASVELVELEPAILPALVLAPQVMGEDAYPLDHSGRDRARGLRGRVGGGGHSGRVE